MRDVETNGEAFGNPRSAELRRRIGWICRVVRWSSAFYAIWLFWLIGSLWSDPAKVRRDFSFLVKADLVEPERWQLMAGFSIHMVIWIFAAAAIFSVWQLMGEYLKGRIFEPEPAVWLRRVGVFGLLAMALDIVSRPLLSGILSLHMPQGARFIAITFQPNDLLIALFLLAFVALATIFKSAAELAEDHAQIV